MHGQTKIIACVVSFNWKFITVVANKVTEAVFIQP